MLVEQKLKEMGLSDELYVRMNSRGRPLTRFEHYKADLEKRLTLVDSDLAKEIARRFDGIWTDFLWKNRPVDKSASLEFVDRAFMNIFGFVCDVICYTRGQSNNGRSHDEFVMLDRFFTVSDMTKAELTAYAAEHGISLEGCNTKADMLSAISAANGGSYTMIDLQKE